MPNYSKVHKISEHLVLEDRNDVHVYLHIEEEGQVLSLKKHSGAHFNAWCEHTCLVISQDTC